MENKAIQFIKNFSYTISSNLISLIISTLVVIVVPKLVGVEEYGYWQLYLFYSSYVGFLHFGWSDGIYLRYGGEEYSDLDKKIFSSQFYMMMLFQFLVAVIIVIIAVLFVSDIDRAFIFADPHIHPGMNLGSSLPHQNISGFHKSSIASLHAHTLYARPMVIDSGEEICIRLSLGKREDLLTLDGQHPFTITGDTEIHISRYKEKARTVRFHDRPFFQVLGEKIGKRK